MLFYVYIYHQMCPTTQIPKNIEFQAIDFKSENEDVVLDHLMKLVDTEHNSVQSFIDWYEGHILTSREGNGFVFWSTESFKEHFTNH